MMGTTHQQVGVAAAVGLSAAASLPLSAAAVVVVSAARWSSTPDRMEKRFRAEHRTWTHWLVSCLATAVLPVVFLVLVAVVVGGLLQYGWQPASFNDWVGRVPAVWEQVDRVARGHRWHGSLAEFVAGLALIVGLLVAIGRVAGMCMHTLADGCTPHGSPILGPFCKRPLHLLPHWLRIKTDSVDDTSLGYWALGVTVLIVYLSLRGLTVPELSKSHA